MVDTLVTLLLLEKYRAYSLPHCHIYKPLRTWTLHEYRMHSIPAISQAKYITYTDWLHMRRSKKASMELSIIIIVIATQMEAKIIVARLLQSFHINLPEGYKLQFVQRSTHPPQDDVPCTLECRSSAT